MTIWDAYPADYRAQEVKTIQAAVLAGECAAVIGLSGAGKSNLFGFLAHRTHPAGAYILVDGNRLVDMSPNGYYTLVLNAIRAGFENFNAPDPTNAVHPLAALETALNQRLQG